MLKPDNLKSAALSQATLTPIGEKLNLDTVPAESDRNPKVILFDVVLARSPQALKICSLQSEIPVP